MNPMTNVKNVKKLSELELKRNLKTSWHDQYKDSAWIFVGGLPYDLTEGDVICVFSQYGEIVNLNLVRDKATGKSKGFCFLCYEDQHSTVLAVDNLNGIKLLGRTIRVDHVSDYKPPKDSGKLDDVTRKLISEGCASTPITATTTTDLTKEESAKIKKEKKDKSKIKSKKDKKKKKRKKKKKQVSSSEDSSVDSSESDSESESCDSDDDSNETNQKSKKRKRRRNGKKHKKKSKADSSDSGSSIENETIRESREKRRLLVEKIKTLEAVLNHKVRKANENGENKNKDKRSSGSDGSVDYHDKQKNHHYQNGNVGHVDRRNIPGTSKSYPHERSRERSRNKEHMSRDRDRNKHWDRSYDHHRR
ncbi:hypothetical protein L9F63_005006 [Diploptera punctata]|uniref:RRM domain-containing protein n=1 Tax=Diploptera punctata TaxID=6984 RepID=A0AAD7ZF64_DIPPU|nr:hypothetical protein L9F63_005006 [Diploptera punctata]